MSYRCLFLVLFICNCALSQAASKKTLYGWQEIPNTTLHSVCPANGYNGVDYDFSFYCQNVTAAWNGGAFDTKRNRLYIWGGGHTDYMGNEIYALDLNQNKMLRLTSPATPLANSMSEGTPSELMPYDGTQPNSRHIYDAMVYLPNEDRLWAFSGSLAGSGATDNITWIFNPNTNRWKRVTPKGTLPTGNYGIVSAYNPHTGTVILHDQHGLYSYRYTSQGGIYTRLVEDRDFGIHLSAEFDPQRNVFVMIGGGQAFLYDLTPGKPLLRAQLKTTGENEIIHSQGPGLAYDPQSKRMIAWAGGNNVYVLDLDKRTWSAMPQPGDPGPAICNGTFGRWAYSPKSKGFVTYNWYENNAYFLKMAATGLPASAKKAAVSKQTRGSKSLYKEKLQQKALAVSPDSGKTVLETLLIRPAMDTSLSIYEENQGRQTYLNLSTNHRVLVKFPGSQLRKRRPIKRAVLRMHQAASKLMPPIYTGVFLSVTDWQEDSNWRFSNPASKTKWRQSPGDWIDRSGIIQGGQPFDLQRVIVKPAGQWLEWDVTALIKHWQRENKTTDLGIVVRSLSGQEQPIQLNSREAADVLLRPQLIVE